MTSEDNDSDRATEALGGLARTYEDVAGRVGAVAPRVIRTIEVLLAVALLALLAHWFYLFYAA